MLKAKFSITFALPFLLGALTLSACGDTESEYSRHQCYFVLDNSQHLDPTLSSAMVQLAPGTFCLISEVPQGESVFFTFESNQGLKSQTKANALEMRRSRILGIYNGIIIGYGSLSSPAVFYAYDRQCPNCYEEKQLPRYPLQFVSTGGLMECRQCKRRYDLNNGGLITQGASGKKLYRYRAATTGPQGVLTVN